MVKKMYNPPRENRVFSTLFSLGRKYAILDDFTQLIIPQHFIKSLGKKALHKARNFVQKSWFFATFLPPFCFFQPGSLLVANPGFAKSKPASRKIQTAFL